MRRSALAQNSDKGFPGTVNSRQKNPMLDLPMATEKVLENVSAVFLTHLHEDHWDEAARKLIRKDLPIFVSSTAARKQVEAAGFKKVTVLDRPMTVEGVTVTPMASQHGTDEMLRTPVFGRVIDDTTGSSLRRRAAARCTWRATPCGDRGCQLW